jgi:predicted  nucleic acid-binding Zn-ribbon protein
MFRIPNPFGSKDKPDDKKTEPGIKSTPPTIMQGDLRAHISTHAGSGPGTGSSTSVQPAGSVNEVKIPGTSSSAPVPTSPAPAPASAPLPEVTVQGNAPEVLVQDDAAIVPQDPPPPPVPEPPSIAFDASSVEAFKKSFDRMANALDKLTDLNEQHRSLQAENITLFSGLKDEKISDLEKSLAASEALVTKRDEEIVTKIKMLDDSTIELEALKKSECSLSVELANVQSQLSETKASLGDEKSTHDSLKEVHGSLQIAETALKTKQTELEATIVDLNSQVRAGQQTIEGLRKEIEDLRGTMSRRLAQFVPTGILESKIAAQVVAFDDEAAAGDASSLGVIAGLSQLRAAFVPGAGPDHTKAAVKSIGSALYAAWSNKSQDAKSIHAHFVQWQGVLNNLPSPGYQLVVPDLGQSVPTNVTAPAGVTKVSEVQLWIVKGGDGGIYSKGIVR